MTGNIDSENARRTKILAATLDVLRQEGITGLTTVRIAAAAHCSKETIYAQFGDKNGLIRALTGEQANAVNAILARQIENGDDPLATLARAGAALLDLLTGEASMAINRAAMTDRSGELGRLLRAEGRGRTAPLFGVLIGRLVAGGHLAAAPAGEIFPVFEGLLVGSRQIRALLGDATARPKPGEFAEIARLAVDTLVRLYPPDRQKA